MQKLGKDWRLELNKFLLAYRSTSHTTTGVSPAELFLKRKLTTKLPEFTEGGESQMDMALQQVRDRDSEKKQQAKLYADTKYHAKDRPITVGDAVLLERKRENKLSPSYESQTNYHGPKPNLYKRFIDDCVDATSSSKEELDQFITAVNSFHPALKYTWEISEHSLAFLDIKISINGNSLSTSVHYKPTNSHNYLLHSSSHPQHVKNAIPFSQFLRLRRLCSNDSDFNNKCEEMCQFFKKRGYPDSAITTGKHRAQEIDRNTALQSPQDEETNRIPFTLTYHPQNLAVKNVILKNFKILRNDPETQHIFSLPPLISFKRDKNIGNFLVRSAFKSDNQPGTFKCTRTRCKTCPFISNMVKISGPNRSAKISDHFTCISANVIYCITCTLCKKIYIGETGRRLADRFREHLRDVEKNDTDASKPVARHFNLPNHSHHNMTICGLSLHHGNTESRKNLEQKFIFQLGTLYPHGINERLSFH